MSHSKMPKKFSLFLSTDFETLGVTGPIFDDDVARRDANGKVLLGEAEYGIIEGCFRILDTESFEVETQIGGFISLTDSYISNHSNAETIEFHKKNKSVVEGANYWDHYRQRNYVYQNTGLCDGLLHDPRPMYDNLSDMEEEVVAALHRIVKQKFDVELKPFTYDGQVEIVILGKSVGFDKRFIDSQMPNLSRFLCYQPMDTSLLRLSSRLWEDKPRRILDTYSSHNADDDCKSAELEARIYQDTVRALPKDHRFLSDALDDALHPSFGKRLWRWLFG